MSIPRTAAAEVFRPDVFANRVVVVTGGGSGIGRATALLFARLGARVVVIGRRPEALAETVELAANEQLAPMQAVPCDIREPELVDAALDTVLAQHEHIDVLVNNAGGQFISPAESISYNGFRAVTRLNLDASWYLTTQVAARSMIVHRNGVVVSITMTPRRGMPGMAHSSAARAAVESLTRTWAMEWGQYGIRTAAVAPGIVHTEAFERYGVDPADAAATVPLRRLETVDEVAATIAFIASPAGGYITGTTIVVDGGVDISAGGGVRPN